MSDRILQASVAAALHAGRSVIVPSPQRAAALGLAWAQAQLAAGRTVWSSPDILTWDAWLRREWERASAAGRIPAATLCLGSAQELLVWEAVLDELEPGGSLRQFAAELMRTAARAVQEDIHLGAGSASEEEALLLRALAGVRDRTRRDSLVALPLLPPAALEQVVQSPAPLIVGQQRLTALQSALAASRWPATQVLESAPEALTSEAHAERMRYIRGAGFEAEICAAADWCEQLLQQDATRRLLIVSALAEPRLPALGDLLWRSLSAGTAQELSGVRDARLLAIEGGEPLLQHGLIADALDVLQLMRDPVETAHLGRVLLSPYFGLGTDGARAQLELELRKRGRARWTLVQLRQTLTALGSNHPAAGELAQWLSQLSRLGTRTASASGWARAYSDSLAACRFAATTQLDTQDAQRLERWNELLDEFASLDCVSRPLSGIAAVRQLRALAARGRHRAASGDAAITLTDELGDPVVHYDGIWVLGLSENRWPRPPRPNPFVPLSEQRRCHWPEAGVTQRLEQARWAQQCWGARTSRLVLSYPAMEGDVHHRPSSLLPANEAAWVAVTARFPAVELGLARVAMDESLPAVPVQQGPRLRKGVQLLELQQACAFRAQAQLRLGAAAPETISDGIDKRLRGTLLHRTLDGLWRELAGQEHLAALSETQRLEAIDRCWQQAVLQCPRDRLPADPRVMQREALRTRRILQRILALETQRAPFRVRERELSVPAVVDDWELNLRIDRVDELQDGSRLLLDYKSGAPEKMRLDGANASPIQLAAYVAALMARDSGADAVALLSLSPREKDLGFTGRARDASLLPAKIRVQAGWEALTRDWQRQISRLVQEHVHGHAAVAPLPGACDYCHLDPLCRITDHPPDPDEVTADE